jgi:hypothetical protein
LRSCGLGWWSIVSVASQTVQGSVRNPPSDPPSSYAHSNRVRKPVKIVSYACCPRQTICSKTIPPPLRLNRLRRRRFHRRPLPPRLFLPAHRVLDLLPPPLPLPLALSRSLTAKSKQQVQPDSSSWFCSIRFVCQLLVLVLVPVLVLKDILDTRETPRGLTGDRGLDKVLVFLI